LDLEQFEDVDRNEYTQWLILLQKYNLPLVAVCDMLEHLPHKLLIFYSYCQNRAWHTST
jgi:hypothetical protein